MITAQQVKELRDRTGISMMDCKDALSEANGDIEKAIKIIKDSIEEVPSESLLYYRLVIYLMDSGRYKESINVLESALSLNFDNHEVLFDFVPNFETQSALIRVINQYRKNELQ